jgi:hypothetical protein
VSKQGQFRGYVLFVLSNKGSKSEHYAPILVEDDGVANKLFKEGDNPFIYENLKPYHQKYCLVTGSLDSKKGVITVESIECIEDPIFKVLNAKDDENISQVKSDLNE